MSRKIVVRLILGFLVFLVILILLCLAALSFVLPADSNAVPYYMTATTIGATIFAVQTLISATQTATAQIKK